jgi:hypothetical protein
MSFEDEDLPRDVVESPSDRSEAGVAQLARDGQVKDADQQEQEAQHEIARKNYDTASSVDLPRIDLDFDDSGGLVAKVGDKKVNLGPADDGPVLAMDPTTGEMPDLPYDEPIRAFEPMTVEVPNGELPFDGPITAVDPMTAEVPAGELPDLPYDEPIRAFEPMTVEVPTGELPFDGPITAMDPMTGEARPRMSAEEIARLAAESPVGVGHLARAGGGESPAEGPPDAGGGAVKGDSAVKGDGPPKVREGTTVVDRPAEVDPEKLKEIHDNPAVKRQREQLEQNIKGLPPEQQERFRKNVEDFEKRAASANPPLKPEEVAKTLHEINLLVDTPDQPGQPLNKAERINVADQVLQHAAHPTSIDQGKNNTCNVTTVESRMFTREPSKAAEMIRALAIDGEYETNGKPPLTVKLDREKLKAGSEESNNPPKDGQRSHASKIFQEGAIAISHERHGVKVRDDNGKVVAEYPPGSVDYRKGEPQAGAKPPNDTGEQLIDKKTGQPIKDANGNEIHAPALDDDHIVDTYNDISGAEPPERGVYLVNDKYVAGEGKHVERIKSEEELKKKLEEAKGPPSKFPIVVGVNTGQEPFFTDSEGGDAGGSGGGHVVTITDYDPKTGEVKIDNQWGRSSDHSISVHDLHRAMMPTGDAIKELEKEVQKNREEGHIDRAKELELLRLKHQTGQMSDAEYDKHVIFQATQAVKEAKERGGYLDRQTQEELQGAIKSIENGKNGERRMQEIRKGVDGDVVKRIADQDSPFVGDIDLPPDYATKQMQAEVDAIHDAKGILNDDEDAVYRALEGKSPEEIKQMEELFQKKYGMKMEDYINSFMDEGPEQEKVRALLAKAHGNPIPASPAPAPGVTPPPGPPPKGDAGGGGDSRSMASLPEGAALNNMGSGALKGDAGPAKGDSGPKGGGDAKVAQPVDRAKAAADADSIYDAKGILNDDEEAVYKALEGKTAAELKAMEEEFAKKHPGMKMEDYIMSFMDEGKEQDRVRKLLADARARDAGGDKAEKPADKPAEAPGNSPEDLKKCEEARKDLENDIDSRVKDAKLAKQMKEQIENFEKRQPPVSAKERADFYEQIDKLIEHQDKPGARKDLPKEGDRQKLALQVLEQANKPNAIDQGHHSTCGTAAMESRLYTKNPAAVARAVTEVATTGKLTPQPQPEAGPAVEVHPSVLKPDADAKSTLKDGTGMDQRSYASQIFQGAATTLEREGYRQDGKKSGREGDTGERYGKDENFEGLTGKEVWNIERKLTGTTGDDRSPPIIEGFDSSDRDVSGSQYPGRIVISKGNEAELNRRLQDLKKEGKLPVMIAVDTGQEPFASDASGRPADGAGGKHFVTVTDIDENGNVSIDNQWGSTGDHRPNDPNTRGTVPVGQLSKALGHS